MVDIQMTKDKQIALFYLIYIFIFLTKIRISKSETNNILEFKTYNFRAGSFAINDDGDMIVEYSKDDARLFYGLKKDGSYFFNDNSNHYKTINFGDSTNMVRYESKNIFIYINNNKQYLFSTATSISISELYDLDNINSNTKKKTSEFLGHEIFSFAFSLLKLETSSTKEYLLVHTYTSEETKYGDTIAITKFSFNQNNFDDIQINTTITINNYDYRGRIVSGFTINPSIVILFYLGKLTDFDPVRYIIKIYDYSLNLQNSIPLNDYSIGDFAVGEGLFSKSISLNDDEKIVVFMFYISTDNKSPYCVVGRITNTNDFETKLSKQINGYDLIPKGYLLNDLIKINDNRFAFIADKSDNTTFYISIFDLYENYSKMKIRIYQPNINKYKYILEFATVIYNDYYLVFSSTVIDSSSSDFDQYFSILMIFGYVKGIDNLNNTIDISPYFKDIQGYNSDNNLIMKLAENVTIDNNIFGYKVEKIKLISIPEQICFYYSEDETTKLTNENELNKEYILKQNKNISKMDDLYTLEYQFIVEEPESYADYIIQEIDEPSGDSSSTFERTKFYGKTSIVKFKLCHDFCASCNEYGISNDDQKCLSCLEEYTYDYFDESPNCVPEGYFYDKEGSKLLQCTETNSISYFDKKKNKKICFKNTYPCPTSYPHYNESLKECQKEKEEICLYEDLLSNQCSFLNLTNTEIYNKIKEEILQNYPSDGVSIVIEGEDNYVFQITNGGNEQDSLNGESGNEYNLSMIDLGKCEELLREEYGIDNETELIILKFEKISSKASEKNVQYEIYDPINKTQLNLSICEATTIDLYIPIALSEETQKLYDDLSGQGYDLFNENDSFYQDLCATYTSQNGTDVLLSDRQSDFYNSNETTCQANCHYSDYLSNSQYLKCECGVTDENIDTEEPQKFTGIVIFTSFYNVLKYSNIGVLKCYKLVFSLNSLTNNYGSIIIIIYFSIYFICLIVFTFKVISPLKIEIAKMLLKTPLNEANLNMHLNLSNKLINQQDKISISNKRSKFKNKEDKIKERKSKKIKTDSQILSNKKFKGSKRKNIGNNHNHKKSNSNNIIKINNISFPPKRNNHDVLEKESEVYSLKLKKDNKIKTKKNSNSKSDNLSVTIHKTQSLNSKRKFVETPSPEDINFIKKINIEQTKDKSNQKENKDKKEEEKLSDFELNDLEYLEAIELDKRQFAEVYWSILKREHIILFTFFSCNDYNIIYIKLARFIFLIATDMAMNVIFFSDDSMHKIYLNYGKYDFVQQIPQIIYSTAISQLLEVFLCFLSLTDKYFYQIKGLKNDKHIKDIIFRILRCITIKLISFFVFTFIFFVFYWYLVSAFCAVYSNTQITFIKDSTSSFLTGLIYPFVLYLIPSVLRMISLKDNTKKRLKFVYKLSDILPIF